MITGELITIRCYPKVFSYLRCCIYYAYSPDILHPTSNKKIVQFIINGGVVILWRKVLQIIIYKIAPFIPSLSRWKTFTHLSRQNHILQ